MGDPEVVPVVDVVGDEGSGMLDGESKGAASSFVDLVPPVCSSSSCCVRLDIADLEYGGDSRA